MKISFYFPKDLRTVIPLFSGFLGTICLLRSDWCLVGGLGGDLEGVLSDVFVSLFSFFNCFSLF